MITFQKVSGQKPMLQIKIDGKETWVNCPEAVKSFAGKAIQAGDEVEIQENGKGDNGLMNITRIYKRSQGGQQPTSSTTTSTTAAPSKPQEAPKSSYQGSYRQPLTPEETRKIMRQSVMSSACHAMTVLTGQVDQSALADVTISLFNRLLAEVEK